MVTKKTKPVKPAKKLIDYDKVSELAGIFCTVEEIADILGTETKKLSADAKFNEVCRKAAAEGKSKLRKMQFENAKDNATLLNWLGRQFLGQKERSESSGRNQNYDLSKLPDFYLNRIINGEDPLTVISEFEHVSAAISNKS
jgi:hypothetical protein